MCSTWASWKNTRAACYSSAWFPSDFSVCNSNVQNETSSSGSIKAAFLMSQKFPEVWDLKVDPQWGQLCQSPEQEPGGEACKPPFSSLLTHHTPSLEQVTLNHQEIPCMVRSHNDPFSVCWVLTVWPPLFRVQRCSRYGDNMLPVIVAFIVEQHLK